MPVIDIVLPAYNACYGAWSDDMFTIPVVRILQGVF